MAGAGAGGVHWPRAPLHNTTIKVTIKPVAGVTSLPSFDDYVNATDTSKLHHLESSRIEQHTFKWQEKVFSPWEVRQYADVHSCTTELQLKYHEIVKRDGGDSGKIFTYIHEDGYEGEPLTTDTNSFDDISTLGAVLKRLSLGEVGGREESVLAEPSLKGLGRSGAREREDEVEWTAMHVMLDDSEEPDKELVIRQESLLVSLHHNPRTNCLIIKPDVNELEWNPYVVRSGTGRDYHYAVELCHEEHDEEVLEARRQFIELVKKLKRKWNRMHDHLFNFAYPPVSKRRHYVTLEILYASNFEEENLYVQFLVAPSVIGGEKVEGRTHTARLRWGEEGAVAHYGHLVEFEVDSDVDDEASRAAPHLYLEVISRDWWHRHRSEGYAHAALCLRPGRGERELQCARVEGVDADSRRFFIGGCNLLEDVSWLAVPEGHEGTKLNKFGIRTVSTGSVAIRLSVVTQVNVPGLPDTDLEHGRAPGPSGRVSSDTLFRSVNSVLHEYKRARERLLACREDMDLGGPSFL